MQFSADNQTLAYHLNARPLTMKLAFKDMPAKHLAEHARKFLDGNTSASPEREALKFYLANHVIAVLRKRRKLHEPLDKMELQHLRRAISQGNSVFLRLLYYVAVICVREARHLHNGNELQNEATAQGFGSAMKFIQTVNDNAQTAMNQFMDKMPAGLSMWELAACLSFVFHKGKWSGGYGGKAWGNVADCMLRCVTGEYTPEMFCDVGFTLAHNGGPIFNKGMFYSMYGSELTVILDVQRSGQIPQYLAQCPSADMQLKAWGVSLGVDFGTEFQGEVDWEQVQKLGGVGNYSHKISDKAKIAAAKKEAEKAAKLAKFVKGTVQVWPGKDVSVISREALKSEEFAELMGQGA